MSQSAKTDNNIELRNVLDEVFRANPQYELILFDRLTREQQIYFADLRNDPKAYGVLRPRTECGLTLKSVCCDTALLFLTLQTPGFLPSYVRNSATITNKAIAELVLDGILEIRASNSPPANFVSGIDAYKLIYAKEPIFETPGRVGSLSIDALRYGQALELEDAGRLSARLYFYNRLPATPIWLTQIGIQSALVDWLGLAEKTPLSRRLKQHWQELTYGSPSAGWRAWRHKHNSGSNSAGQGTYKLYVSPAMKEVPWAFAATIRIIGESQAFFLKVGADAHGLLRPDKLVAYFNSLRETMEAAELLKSELRGCPAHGVPFTAEISDDGLLSWGIDPPASERMPGWQEQESWRLWLTNRLAVSLIAARSSRQPVIEPWRFAMERVSLEGVDTRTWIPHVSLWENPLHSKG